MTHSCQLLAISLACLIADVAGSGAQDAKPEKATAATQAATPDRPAAVPAAANTVPPKPITFEVGKTKVSVSEGTEADGRNALAVATKFLKLWHENDVENAVELAVPHMRDGFHNQMTKNKLASPEVTALGVFRAAVPSGASTVRSISASATGRVIVPAGWLHAATEAAVPREHAVHRRQHRSWQQLPRDLPCRRCGARWRHRPSWRPPRVRVRA